MSQTNKFPWRGVLITAVLGIAIGIAVWLGWHFGGFSKGLQWAIVIAGILGYVGGWFLGKIFEKRRNQKKSEKFQKSKISDPTTPEKWQVWRSEEDDGLSITCTKASTVEKYDQKQRDLYLGLNPELIYEFEASTYNEAMQKHYDFMGYGTYVPMEGTK